MSPKQLTLFEHLETVKASAHGHQKREKDVEDAYRTAIRRAAPRATITSPHGSDGLVEWKGTRLLFEAKYDLDLKDRNVVCDVLTQVVMYLKKFEHAGEKQPNVLLVGDVDECFVLGAQRVSRFLAATDVDWTCAPSTGCPVLRRYVRDGLSILPHVYDINAEFGIAEVLRKAEWLAKGVVIKYGLNAENVRSVYAYWVKHVQAGDVRPKDSVDVFYVVMLRPKLAAVNENTGKYRQNKH